MISKAYEPKIIIKEFWNFSNEYANNIQLPDNSCLKNILQTNYIKRQALYTIKGEKSIEFCEFLSKSLTANTKTNILYVYKTEPSYLNKNVKNNGKLYITKFADIGTIHGLLTKIKSLSIDILVIEDSTEIYKSIIDLRKWAIDNNITVIFQKNKLYDSITIFQHSDVVLSVETLNEDFYESNILKCRFSTIRDDMNPVLKSSLTDTDKQFIG